MSGCDGKWLRLTPLDTLFFGDSTPFLSGGTLQDVVSVFPPYPPTVAGAIRAWLARGNGWDGRGDWSQTSDGLREVLGNGSDDLGKLRFAGPVVVRGKEMLFPAPRHMVGETDGRGVWQPKGFLFPGGEVLCDIGEKQLPYKQEGMLGLGPPAGLWITESGLEKVVRGELPENGDLVPREDIFVREPRIGIEIEEGTRKAKEGMLYGAGHVRLREGVSLAVLVEGVPQDWKWPFEDLAFLGGETRKAFCEEWERGAQGSPVEVGGKFLLIALTPLALSREEFLGEKCVCVPFEFKVVSACADRPVRVGGWDSVKKEPLCLKSYLPAGTVLFCEKKPGGDDPAVGVEGIAGCIRVGNRTEMGFGLAAVGAWVSQEERI